MIIRSLSFIDWMLLARQKAASLQEHVAGPEAWDFNMALRKAVIGQLLPVGERWHHWVAIKDQKILGLVIARERGSSQIWQVSHLLLSCEAIDPIPILFQQVTAAAHHNGIEKLFLRLPQDSPIKQIAFDNGFEPYMVERLYQCLEPQHNPSYDMKDDQGTWRSKTKQDNWAIYQIYSSVSPSTVRQAEGLSFNEWLQAREKKKGSQEKVWEKSGQIRGCVRLKQWRKGLLFEFLFYPDEEMAIIPVIRAITRRRQPVYSLIYSYQTEIQRLLEAEGFCAVSEHSLLLKRMLARVKQTRLAPMRV